MKIQTISAMMCYHQIDSIHYSLLTKMSESPTVCLTIVCQKAPLGLKQHQKVNLSRYQVEGISQSLENSMYATMNLHACLL